MARPSPEKIADIVLGRRQVYDLDADSRIQEAANRLTARALFELLERLDDEIPEFTTALPALLADFPDEEVSYLVGFDPGGVPSNDQEHEEQSQPEKPTEHYLKLVFRNEDAAYYQFPFFPHLEAPYILGAARKRTGNVQHLRIELSHPGALQLFIESCRSNPHFLRIEESTESEFIHAPSNAV